MVDLYARLIINKRRTIDKVPKEKRQAVVERLRELGYDQDGQPIEV